MRNLDQNTITQEVIDRFADTPDPRLKEIIRCLVRHLHDFAREIHLTEDEWAKGVAFLTETGQKCDDKRQEFILLSDVLGLSMLTVAMNHAKPAQCTEATVFGPFFVEGAPHYDNGGDVANGASGEPCEVSGTVRDIEGRPIVGARIDVWQADSEGMYDVQRAELERLQGRGVLRSDEAGAFRFLSVLPEAYPIPTDGPVGALLQATGRHPWRPAHLHFRIEAHGYETLVTHVFREDDPWLDSDAVFGVRQSLIAPWVRGEDGAYTLHYDFVLSSIVGSRK
ncbi:hydroxyquinol 1,2-dioxygenase [Burkholderia diffusa]|uniref:Hydroxyquinol 1,2-dioxygenase n=1 Tax=Burkholderia diffusa TaxID=488732 RepID=A0AAW3PB23_9BURK|nr:intradiol ring-cleavage dioxygenase [Burkholderia diffusa]KWF32686.1 hydroxyquinol 1,2-dioxygenase [Burkholderia diffusa]KWF38611.1 hydroxyquinol 1,2-dioxygenase [Burkholderia diffusa]KWF46656.1 hydroxyquinol 1,2-dioxygenase [Burkholderia diffusa]KWF50770.1 hydroxyquinol 1,2-dioxygenase [Burkholderia diffusa]